MHDHEVQVAAIIWPAAAHPSHLEPTLDTVPLMIVGTREGAREIHTIELFENASNQADAKLGNSGNTFTEHA